MQLFVGVKLLTPIFLFLVLVKIAARGYDVRIFPQLNRPVLKESLGFGVQTWGAGLLK